METIKVYCDQGHLLCEIAVVGECVLAAGCADRCAAGVLCYPDMREVHLSPCRRCADEGYLRSLDAEPLRARG